MSNAKGFVDLGSWGRVGVLEAAAGLDNVQKGLASARAEAGFARCLCVDDPRKLQIRRRGQRLHLAVWPDDGDAHAESCPFRRVHTHDQAITECPAIVHKEHGLSIKLSNSLMHWAPPDNRPKQGEATREAKDGEEAENPGQDKSNKKKAIKGLNLDGLWDLLWRQAGLAEWRPGWTRDYWRVSKNLTKAVSEIKVGERPLQDLLQVVPPWRESSADAIRAIWEAFDASLDRKPGETVPTSLILGEIDNIRKSAYGWQLRLKHTRPTIFVDEDVRASWAKAWPDAVEALNHEPKTEAQTANSNAWRKVLGLLQIIRSQRGNLIALAGHLWTVEGHYMTSRTADEAALVQALIEQRRHFGDRTTAAMDEDRIEGLPYASHELYDTDPITALAAVVQLAPAMAARVEAECDEGSPWWIWCTTDGRGLPELPPMAATA